ncbi:non-heme iron oxygenase ferredoxin subunit [Bradyrhizobium cytisi]|uniref:Non-heme iron oxygenase ferredoxin subunit n=2 Tax=Bradyrhizobium TaxID=374 RepID=A0A5S4W033_9BRAD|nr:MULTISPECIES: non-heme iron oxygenase ferredoxin subunit [Bradyrhizobium]TYL72337.1 non-heme iron oxygenase ferredoxin subunit [Bradyrhizobium cytisi]
MTVNWIGLCRLDDLPGDGMYAYEVGSKKLAVYLLDGKVYATDNVCTHAFALLTDGWLEDGLVECPLHGAQFDVTTGAVVRGPADCAVPVFETRIRDGLIEVRIDD